MTHGLDDIARARLALGTNHGRTLGDTAQRLAQVLRAAHERHVELVLVDVVHVVGGAQNLGFVDVVDFDGLQNAGFGNMADAHLRHDRDGHGFLDALDHGRVAHAGDATGRANVGRNTLERHHRACARVLRDLRLLGVVTSIITPPLSICARFLFSSFLLLAIASLSSKIIVCYRY